MVHSNQKTRLHPSYRLQFGLRSLFVAVTFVAVLLSWWADHRIQLAQIAELERQVVVLKGPHLLGHFPQRRPVTLKTGPIAFAALRDGSKVVCANDENAVEVWEMTTAQKLLSIKHSELVLDLSVSPDESTVATVTAGRDAPVHIWNLKDGSLLRKYFRSSPPQGIVAAASWETTLHSYASRTGFGFTAVLFSPTGEQLAAGCEDGSILIFDTKSGKETARLAAGNVRRIRFMAISPDGTRIVAASEDLAVQLWDIASGTLLRAFQDWRPPGGDKRITPVAFSPDGATFACFCLRWPHDVTLGESIDVDMNRGPIYQIVLFDSQTGKIVRMLEHTRNLCPVNIAYLPDGIIMADMNSAIVLWDVASGREQRRHTCAGTIQLDYIEPLSAISSVMAVVTENDEDTLHEDWTRIAIVPFSSFQEISESGRP